MPSRRLSDYSTDELLYELLKLTRRQQWEADPLRFGCEVFSQHFSKPPAAMHRAILQSVVGASAGDTPTGVGESDSLTNTPLPFSPSPSTQISNVQKTL